MRLFTIFATALFAGLITSAETPARPEAERKAALEASLDALKSIKAGLGDRAGLAEALAVARRTVRRVSEMRWKDGEREPWSRAAVELLKDAWVRAQEAKETTPPDRELAARMFQLACAVAAGVGPEEFPAVEQQALRRDMEEARDTWLFGDKPPMLPAPKDLMAADWTWSVDEGISSTRDKDGWTLENVSAAGPTGLVTLSNAVSWEDFRIRIEFTADDSGFVLHQRHGDDGLPAVQHDIRILQVNGAIKAGEPCTLDFWVYGSRARIVKGDAVGRPGRCAPSGSRAGGFSFRLPPGAKLVIRKLEVTVLSSDE